MINTFIRNSDYEFISERFFLSNSCVEDKTGKLYINVPEDKINVTEDKIKMFMERLVSDWDKGRVTCVFCNTNKKSGVFRNRFMSYLKTTETSLQSKLATKRDKCFGDKPLFMIFFMVILSLHS